MATVLLVEVCPFFSTKRIRLSVHSFTFLLSFVLLSLPGDHCFSFFFFPCCLRNGKTEHQCLDRVFFFFFPRSVSGWHPPSAPSLLWWDTGVFGQGLSGFFFLVFFFFFLFISTELWSSRELAVEGICIMLLHKSLKTTFWQMGIWLHRWVPSSWHSKYPQWWMKVISFWIRQVFCRLFFVRRTVIPDIYFVSSFFPSFLPPFPPFFLLTEDELQLPALHYPALRRRIARCHRNRHHPFYESLPGPAHVRWPPPHLHQSGWSQCPGHRRERRRLSHQHLHRPQLSRLQQ